jgi:hypothetical protein
MPETEFIQDMWAPLATRPIMQGDGNEALAAPKYLTGQNARRVNAYHVLRALMDNTARWHLAEDERNPDKADEWREFGDPAVFVERIAAGVLGEEQTIVVDQAGEAVPSEPEIDPEPAPPSEGGNDHPTVQAFRKETYEASVAAWELRAREQLEAWELKRLRVPLAKARQDWLRDWADKAMLVDLMTENERENIVPLGSGVYRLGWDRRARRPRVDIFEPDVYMPRLDDTQPGDFPTRVDLVWNVLSRPLDKLDDPEAKEEEFVKRITYELVPIEEAQGLAAAAGAGISISAPLYHGEGDVHTSVCVVTEETFPADSFELVDGPNENAVYRTDLVDPLQPDGEVITWNRLPIGLDFIPLVHVPHTPSSTNHFGRPPLVRVMQVLDEIAAADGEEALAAVWAARPLLGLSGMQGTPGGADGKVDVAPGDGVRLSEKGAVTKVDMGAALVALGEYADRKRSQATVALSVPDGLIGRVDASEVPSGISLLLSFTPFQQAVLLARLSRDRKHALLLKQVQRIAIQEQDETLGGSTEVFDASIELGTFMPQDLQTWTQIITELLRSKAISQETAIAMLVALGVPVEDAKTELMRIRATMAAEADLINAATEQPALAGRFLGYSDAELADRGDAGAPEGEDGGAPAPTVGADIGAGLLG